MIKSALLGVAIALVLFGAVTVVLRWRYQHQQEERAAERLPELRAEAFKAAKLCDSVVDESLAPAMAMAMSKFGFYLATDRKRLSETLTTVVEPVISSRQMACSNAKTSLELFIEKSPTLDAFAMPRLVRAHAHLVRLDALEHELDATRDAIDHGANDAELLAHFARLRSRP
ncbi:MAG TPA: hypothetical protein VFV99_23315 [Kofleriaceae bacterium]|nr:hypothetical protein [Kofleriaceae bacterium]